MNHVAANQVTSNVDPCACAEDDQANARRRANLRPEHERVTPALMKELACADWEGMPAPMSNMLRDSLQLAAGVAEEAEQRYPRERHHLTEWLLARAEYDRADGEVEPECSLCELAARYQDLRVMRAVAIAVARDDIFWTALGEVEDRHPAEGAQDTQVGGAQ